MTAQLPLFGAPQAADAAVVAAATPLHRRSDSHGSRAAAKNLVAKGWRATHDAAVLEALARRPWSTSLELDRDEHAFLSSLGVRDRTETARRLPGLLKRQMVIRLDPDDNPSIRPCSRAQSKCHRWAVAGTTGAAAWLTDPTAIPVIDRGGEKALATEAVA